MRAQAVIMCFRCLIFRYTLCIVIFALFYCLLDMSCSECNVISLYALSCSVDGSVCFVCCVFYSVSALFQSFHNMFGCGCYFVLKVMKLFSVDGGALIDKLCMVFQRVRVVFLLSQCAFRFPFHMCCLCLCMTEVIS